MALPLLLGGLAAFASRAFIYAVLARVLVGLGVTLITYTGVTTMMDAAIGAIQAQMGGLSADMLTILTIARVDDGLSVILSACVARMTLAGLTNGGVLSKITWGKQGQLF